MLIFYLLLIIYAAFLLYVTVSLLLENRNHSKTLLWIFVLFFIPVIGLIFYFAVGKNMQKKKINPTATNSEYPGNSIIKLLLNNSNSTLYHVDEINVYASGKDTFEAMLDAIENAKQYILIEFFIFRNDRISNRLREMLEAKAQTGVKIYLIYDYLGSFVCGKKYWNSLRRAGVHLHSFFPLNAGLSKINSRNHRKILVIDGKTGFTGGLNIADRYYFGNKLGMWRDTFVSLHGEAVCGLQNVFLDDWQSVTKNQSVIDCISFPKPDNAALPDAKVQIVGSGPDSTWEAIMQGMAAAISTAKKYVYMQTPYFVPNELIYNTILLMAMRGVDVRMMLPEVSDTPLLDACTESYLEQMLRAGVKIYKYSGNFMHCKTIVADDSLSITGSTNLDERSFNQNFEVNAFIYDENTAKKFRKLFENDMQSCRLYTYDEWKKRSAFKHFISSLVRLLSPVL